MKWGTPDLDPLLTSAAERLKRFFIRAGVSTEGTCPIHVIHKEVDGPESYRIEVRSESIVITGHDREGLRRAIYRLEEKLAASDGPFLELGTIQDQPAIRTRISRCFFGPIQRPPLNRDELADEIDYYPEPYLDRLAADGINGLWITVRFSDLCDTTLLPNQSEDRSKRLKKLNTIVERCAKYGIRIFPFCIEPRGFGGLGHNKLTQLRQSIARDVMGGALTIDGVAQNYFCTSTKAGLAYLEEASYSLFHEIPQLGGLIMINLGERPTHCFSSLSGFLENSCPRCGRRSPWEVFRDLLTAIQKGMRAANPSAELISWLYTPSLTIPGGKSEDGRIKRELEGIARHLPEDVILQINFESTGLSEQLGRTFTMEDYSLAYIGPSDFFRSMAENVAQGGGRMGGKIQVGCSHEVATTPFVPVPGHLYRKYKAMHQLGVSSVQQCWFFGNYPSLMTKAAGILSFSPLPENEDAFLETLALTMYGTKAAQSVVQAWRHFQEAYAMFPRNLSFSHYGPVHDAIAWPLHLIPVDEMISRSWQLGHPPSGDRYGELLGQFYSTQEMLDILRALRSEWKKGVDALDACPSQFVDEEFIRDRGIAHALLLQITSAFHYVLFHALRDELPEANLERKQIILADMREILALEIAASQSLAKLCAGDSRLGFHSEAEGYRYYPALLEWRVRELQNVLEHDIPFVEREIHAKRPLFPEFTGAELPKEAARAKFSPDCSIETEFTGEIYSLKCHAQEVGWGGDTFWQARWSKEDLFIRVQLPLSHEHASYFPISKVTVSIEGRRLWPGVHYTILSTGATFSERVGDAIESRWQAVWASDDHSVTYRIALADFAPHNNIHGKFRINVQWSGAAAMSASWVPLKTAIPRTCLGSYHPDNYEWISLEI